MKNVIKVIPLLFLLSSCFFSTENNYYSGIKALIQYKFNINNTITQTDNGDVENLFILSDTLKIYKQYFNTKGRLTEESTYYTKPNRLDKLIQYEYHPNGSIAVYKEYDDDLDLVIHREYRDDKKIIFNYYWGQTTNYTYNNYGNITNIDFSFNYGDSIDTQTCFFEYDEKHNITHSYYYINNNLSREDIFENSYDSKGRISDITYHTNIYYDDVVYTFKYKRNYEYNLTGYKVYHYTYYLDQIADYNVFYYRNNKLINAQLYNSNNELIYYTNNINYHDDYKLLEYTQIDSTNMIFSGVEFNFDKNNLIAISYYDDYNCFEYLEATYDNKNNLLEYTKFNDRSIWDADHSYADSYPNRLDPYFFHNYLIYIYDLYYFNSSSIKNVFIKGHYSFNNYDTDGIWETKIKYDPSDNPKTLYIQEKELY